MGKGSTRRAGENSELLRKNWPFPEKGAAERKPKPHAAWCGIFDLGKNRPCDCGHWEE